VIHVPARSNRGDIRLESITEAEAFAALAPEWDELLADSDARALFLTWTWISTWWEVFGADRRLYILAARDASGTLLGLAPLMVQRAFGAFRPICAC